MGRVFIRVTFALVFFVALTTVIGVVADLATRHWGQLPQSVVIAGASSYGATLLYRIVRSTGRQETPPPRPGPPTLPAAALPSAAPTAPTAHDPGWSPRRSATSGLALLRAVFLSFAASIVVLAMTIRSMAGLANGPVVPWLPILAALAAGLTALQIAAEPQLDCSSARRLAETYRARFSMRMAFAESVALLAFTFTFIDAPAWTYYVGAAFTLVRFATNVAPTRAALARDQANLDARGCELSLVAALNAGSATR